MRAMGHILVQCYLVITDPFITDFGYNGHDFVRYFLRFCPLHPNLRKKIKFFNRKKWQFFTCLGPKCQFFNDGQWALTHKVSPQVVRYNEAPLYSTLLDGDTTRTRIPYGAVSPSTQHAVY